MKKETFEEFMADVFQSPHRKPNMEADPFETEAYQAFVESMIPHCRCRESYRPCDGVLAGGICDGIEDEPEREEIDHDDPEDY